MFSPNHSNSLIENKTVNEEEIVSEGEIINYEVNETEKEWKREISKEIEETKSFTTYLQLAKLRDKVKKEYDKIRKEKNPEKKEKMKRNMDDKIEIDFIHKNVIVERKDDPFILTKNFLLGVFLIPLGILRIITSGGGDPENSSKESQQESDEAASEGLRYAKAGVKLIYMTSRIGMRENCHIQ